MIQIKNAKELDGMRRANALSAAALKYGGQHIEAGMTTWELVSYTHLDVYKRQVLRSWSAAP